MKHDRQFYTDNYGASENGFKKAALMLLMFMMVILSFCECQTDGASVFAWLLLFLSCMGMAGMVLMGE